MIKNSPTVKFELISQMLADENNVMSVTELCRIAVNHLQRAVL